MNATTRATATIILAAIAAIAAPQANTLETYFSPHGGCAAAISKQLDAATSTIDIAAYELTYKPLADSIIAASQRGIQIRIILDRAQETEPCPIPKTLRSAGLNLKTDRSVKLQHNKYAIIDNATVMTGSYNWTANAENANAENVVIIHDTVSANAFTVNFNQHWTASVPFSTHAAKHPYKKPTRPLSPPTPLPAKKDSHLWQEYKDPSTRTEPAAHWPTRSRTPIGKAPAPTYASA